MQTVSL